MLSPSVIRAIMVNTSIAANNAGAWAVSALFLHAVKNSSLQLKSGQHAAHAVNRTRDMMQRNGTSIPE
jgi:hypothetical protein